MPSELLSREAIVPGVPVVGAPAEWKQFAEDLRQNIALCWSRPRAEIRQALEWVRDARNALAAADLRAAEHRARADRAARRRIEARNKLEKRLDALEAALEEERGRLNDAALAVDEAAKARDDLDERYREAVGSMQALGGGELDSVNPTEVLPVVARVRELLALRNELEQSLRSARDGERDGSEQVALTLAEEVETRRVLADVELEEQDEGQRAELLAARTTDEVITAQRAFENACLNLYLQYVKRAHASAGGMVDVSINLDAASLATSDFDPDA
jgi:predicted component of type VI protein secretion system